MVKNIFFSSLLFLYFSSVFCQTNISASLEIGATYSNLGKDIEELKFYAYEINPFVAPNFSIGIAYHLNPKIQILGNVGLFNVGYERRTTNQFFKNTELPIHRFFKRNFHYNSFALKGRYSFLKKNSFSVGLRYLKPIRLENTYKEFSIGEIPDFGMPGVTSFSYSEKVSYNDDSVQNDDLGIELAFSHNFWKGVFLKLSFYQGFKIHEHPSFLEEAQKRNQAFSFLLGYEIPILKKKKSKS